MSFQVHSKDLLGRTGTFTSKSGSFSTPHMFPVLDPNHQTLAPEFFDQLGIRAVMTNAYLLKRGKGDSEPVDVHSTLHFKHTVATDSGAYQILEYGGVGVKPDEIIHYQERINADIGVILDVPTGFRSDLKRAGWTVDETVRRADQALKAMTREDVVWMGPVQGGVHLTEVKRSAAKMSKRDFAIYALGSPTELMESQRYDTLVEMILAAKWNLPTGKPFHLFGAGHPVLFPFLVALGCDLFDSAAYALYARAGRYFTSEGTQLLADMTEFACPCSACCDVDPSEVLNAPPKEREARLAKHNLWACFSELRRVREAIRKGRLWDLLEHRARANPALMDCFARICEHSSYLEKFTPSVKPRGISHLGHSSDNRPEMIRYKSRLAGSVDHRRKLLLLLPGRWRRPFHEDPRYAVVAKSFDDHPAISICFYSIAFGPVPLELDETFPIAQTESRDSAENTLYQSKSKDVSKYAKTLRPKRLVIITEDEYGRCVERELSKELGKRLVTVISGNKTKPNDLVKKILRLTARLV